MATSFVGRRVPSETLRIRKEPLRLPLLLLIVWWLLKLAVRLLLVVAGSPVAVTILTVLTLTWAVCQLGHPLYAVAGLSGYDLTCRSGYDLTCRSRQGDHVMGSPPATRVRRSLRR